MVLFDCLFVCFFLLLFFFVKQGENNGDVYYVFAPDQAAIVYELFTVNRNSGIISTKNTTILDEEEYFEISVYYIYGWLKENAENCFFVNTNIL